MTIVPTLLVGEAVACRRPGALVNKSPSAWPGRDSKTDEHLFGTSNGMVRGRALKRRGDGGTLLSWCGNCGTRHQSHEEDRRRCAELRVKRRKHRLSAERIRVGTAETEADGTIGEFTENANNFGVHTRLDTFLQRRNSRMSRTHPSKSRLEAMPPPDFSQDDGWTVCTMAERKARWTTRGCNQLENGNEDFFSAAPAMVQL